MWNKTKMETQILEQQLRLDVICLGFPLGNLQHGLSKTKTPAGEPKVTKQWQTVCW